MGDLLDTEYGLKFGKPKIVMTKFGEREVRDAHATEEFWTAWRTDKEAVRKAGYGVSKNDNGDWKVSLWRETMAREEREAAAKASRAADTDVAIPVPAGRELLPYQKAGVAYALQRSGTLIADEMGLGKTIQAIGVANAVGAKRILVVCPASLLSNWRNEIQRWQTLNHKVQVIRAGCAWRAVEGWTVINYDIVRRYERLKAVEWDLVIFDETHYLKNPKTKRTRWLLGGGRGEEKVEPIQGARKVLLTGTPITNRPAEIFPLLKYLDGKRWSSFGAFARRYCGGSFNGYGIDAAGASNLDELQERLRSTVMVRRLKADVLTELPAKRRQIVTVDVEGIESIVDREFAVHERNEAALAAASYAAQKAEVDGTPEEYRAAVDALQKIKGIAFAEVAKVRHDTAVAKVPAVVKHLENTSGKVVVFAHHRDVVHGIVTALASQGVVSITGDTPNEQRQTIVDRFQTDPVVRFFVGNIQAAGVGLTLTAASHVVFAELDWVPGNVTQAEDRCHRIGQRESVLVQHLVIDGSLDAKMAETIVAKQEMIDKALDVEAGPIEFAVYEPATTAPAMPAAAIEKRPAPVVDLTEEQIAAVHEALRCVAGLDTDRAQALNGIGFSKMDTRFGNELAERGRLTPRQAAAGMKLAHKYRRQYPREIYERIFGVAAEV